MLSRQHCLKIEIRIVYHKSVCRQSARNGILPSYPVLYDLMLYFFSSPPFPGLLFSPSYGNTFKFPLAWFFPFKATDFPLFEVSSPPLLDSVSPAIYSAFGVIPTHGVIVV